MFPDYTPNPEIPNGYCQCGCGQKTKIAARTYTGKRIVKGVPQRFVTGHHNRPSLEQRFWSKVDKSDGEDACWLWTAGHDEDGYGTIFWNGENRRAHRISYILAFGYIPDDLFCLHQCDNPSCVNPSHLFLGTPLDNMRDMIEKGRKKVVFFVGEKVGSSKLTEQKVLYIRERYSQGGITHQELADQLGVEKRTIYLVLKRKTWKHI